MAVKGLKDVFHPTQIVAEGTTNASMKAYCTVTLNIANVNDNLPQFEHAEYTASINEGSGIGTSVTTVKVCILSFSLVVA